jgi:hypothetical protein
LSQAINKIISFIKRSSMLFLRVLFFTVLIIPLAVIPLVPSYIDYKEEIQTPEDNFVLLFIVSMSDISVSDTGIQGYPDVYEGQASGIAISSDEKGTYVLTADHFCQNFVEPSFSSRLFNLGSILKLYDFYGDVWEGEIVFQDARNDLCLVRTNMPISRTISVADSMPDIGEDVHTVSAPLGIGGNGIALHYDGKFSGCQGINCFFTIPATNGSSGSLILNSDGEIVGMTQMAAARMNTLAIGVGVYRIRDFLTRAEEELEAQILQ